MAAATSSEESEAVVTVEESAVSIINKFKINYRWEIQGFQFLAHENGKAFNSPKFPSGDNQPISFRIQLYPRCNTKETPDYVSLFLRLESADKFPVQTEFTFKMMSSDETVICQKKGSTSFTKDECPSKGYIKFIKGDDLEAALKHSKSYTLFVQCEILISVDPLSVGGPIRQSNAQFVKQFPKDYGSLLADSAHSDFIINVKNQKFLVHKAILHAQSSVFAAMLSVNMREKATNEAIIDDEEPNAFKKLLEFIYSGKVNESTEDALELLPLADKYNVQDLKGYCENLLATRLTSENVVKSLIIAETHNSNPLKEQAFRYINAHSEAVSKTSAWDTFVQQYPQLLAELFLAAVKTDSGSA